MYKSKYIKSIGENSGIKILAIIAFIFIILALTIITKTHSASGYEMSIYDTYPQYFWFFVITSIFIGQIVLLRCAFSSAENDKLWIFGFFSILSANAILLFMPLIRGYEVYGRGDVLTHIGFMNDILRNGYIGNSNMYPINHILGVIIFLVSGIKITDITMIIPVIFSFFYVISFYLLAKQIFEKKREVLFTIVFGSILLFGNAHLAFAPNPQSFFLFPFVLYLYFKSRKSKHIFEFSTLAVILQILIVFYHPLSTLMLIMIFLVLEVTLIIKNKIITFKYSPFRLRSSYNLILISLIMFFTWQSYAYVLINSFKMIFSWLAGEAAKSEFQTYSDIITSSKPEFRDIIELSLNMYGQSIILGILSLFCIFYIFIIVRRQNQQLKFFHLFSSAGFLFFFALSLVTFFLAYIIGFGRIYTVAILFSIILISSSLDIILRTKNSFMTIKYGFLCLILISLLYFSTFNLYLSPRVKYDNQQVALSELAGMETFFKNRDEKISILELGLSQDRFYDAIYSKATMRKNVIFGDRLRPVDHFGYTNNISFSDNYENPKYFLLNDVGRNLYPYFYPDYKEKWRFTQEDFNRLKVDSGVHIIYTNGNLNVYLNKKIEFLGK